jgi:transposase-like protein
MAKSPIRLDKLFKGRQFEREIIILCVRWCLRFMLSFRDLVEMMAERGLSLAHATIMRWLQGFAPEFARRWNRFVRQSGESWRVGETYIKIRGVWTYHYRAVDREGKTVDFSRSARRDVMAAKLCFRKALKTQGRPPRVVTLNGDAASHGAVSELPEENEGLNDAKLQSSKYLNNIIEQDKRAIKARIGPKLGCKRFRRAKVAIAGIELLLHIRKNQFDLSKLPIQTRTAPTIGNAGLAA